MTKLHLHNLGEEVIAKIESGGSDGLSAYQIALNNGFTGTEREWLDSLRGNDGEVGADGKVGLRGDGFDISKVYNSVVEMNNDSSNPSIIEGMFVLINSEDEDNGSLYVKKDNAYLFQSKLVGVRGDRGASGQRGRGVVVKGSKPSEGDLPLTAEEGTAYWIADRLYIWSNDPLEIVQPGFVRGNPLKGEQGLEGKPGVGLPGRNGSDASVTSDNVVKALGYIPADQEAINMHKTSTATKTTKGHMQVGEGLVVNNGVVSVDMGIVSKEFLSVANSTVTITIGKAPFDIKFGALNVSNKIPYDSSTGEFTLTKGKAYKIQFVANINTTGRVEIRAVTASGSNATPTYGVWSSDSNDKSPNIYSTIIRPSSTSKYRIRVTHHSVASSTLYQYTGTLDIIEI